MFIDHNSFAVSSRKRLGGFLSFYNLIAGIGRNLVNIRLVIIPACGA